MSIDGLLAKHGEEPRHREQPRPETSLGPDEGVIVITPHYEIVSASELRVSDVGRSVIMVIDGASVQGLLSDFSAAWRKANEYSGRESNGAYVDLTLVPDSRRDADPAEVIRPIQQTGEFTVRNLPADYRLHIYRGDRVSAGSSNGDDRG